MPEHDHSDHDDEVLQHQDKFYILATSSRADDRTRVLKQARRSRSSTATATCSRSGWASGLYHDGTRFLSRLELRMAAGGRCSELDGEGGQRPAGGRPHEPGPQEARRPLTLPRGELHLFRAKFLWRGVCYERLRVSNFGRDRSASICGSIFDADFADIFEVRGTKRERRGHAPATPASKSGTVVLGYRGLDGVVRRTRG